MLATLLVLAVGMFAFAYANAEFFVMLCQEAGLIAKEPSRMRSEIGEREIGRPLEVYFSAHVEASLPIAFSVARTYQQTNVNRAMVNDYSFHNLSNQTIYFRPVHDVSPLRAGLPETMLLEQCFCFTEQKIGPGERYSLPVKYTFTDTLAENTRHIKMNYTLFPSTQESYEASMKAQASGQDPHAIPAETEQAP